MNAHSPPERSLPRKPRSPASIQVMPQTPDGWCEVTVRPCWGRRTPQQDLAELRDEVQRLRARLAELEPRPERPEEKTS